MIGNKDPNALDLNYIDANVDEENNGDDGNNKGNEVLEIQKIIGVCCGKPKDKSDCSLYFKVC